MLPLVSILIPAWNSAPWLGATLDSALQQTHPRIEIIVIDDGSTDQTLTVARARAARHPDRIRVVSQSNAGASAARNHALRLASGDYIQFLDADDLLSPRKIELQLALLSTRAADTLATCRWGRFESDPSASRFVDHAVFRDFSPIDYLLAHVGAGQMMHPAAWLIPRSVAERAGPWDESLSLNDDGEYFARIVRCSVGLAFTVDSAANSLYRSNLSSSLSARRSAKALASLVRSCELIATQVTAIEDSPRSRAALATYWQRLCYELYPEDPAASRSAELRAINLGGSALRPPMGKKQQLLARLIGWRFTYRMRNLILRH